MACALRQSVKFAAFNLPGVFRRNFMMSAQLRAEQAVEEMKKKNPYFEKYGKKIAQLQQTAPEEFLNRLDSVAKKHVTKKSEKTRYVYRCIEPYPMQFQWKWRQIPLQWLFGAVETEDQFGERWSSGWNSVQKTQQHHETGFIGR